MKKQIKQAGFKTQEECGAYLGLSRTTIIKYLKYPKTSKLFTEWLEFRIRIKEQDKLIDRLTGYLKDNDIVFDD